MPSLGLSSEIVFQQNTLNSDFATLGTLYAFKDLSPMFSVFTGWIRNQPLVGVTILCVNLGYNLNRSSIEAYIQGFSF